MKQIRWTGYLLALVTALALVSMITACGSKKAAPVLNSIGVRITHSTIPVLTMHSTTQLDATGNYSDGSTPDLSNDVIWASSNPTVASGHNRPVTGSNAGTTDITAIHERGNQPAGNDNSDSIVFNGGRAGDPGDFSDRRQPAVSVTGSTGTVPRRTSVQE